MLKEIRPAISVLLILTVLTGLIYPLAITGVAQLLFPREAGGSLITLGDQVVGSALIGQNFATPRYFHGRPSATTIPDPKDATKTLPAPYNAANSSGSNLAPTAKALVDRVAGDVKALRDAGVTGPIPADLVTTSASGLDPDISPEAALAQVPIVAKARGVDAGRLTDLVRRQTQGRNQRQGQAQKQGQGQVEQQ